MTIVTTATIIVFEWVALFRLEIIFIIKTFVMKSATLFFTQTLQLNSSFNQRRVLLDSKQSYKYQTTKFAYVIVALNPI